MSIIYLDTSALLKLYIQESYSLDVNRLITSADATGSSLLTYAEMASAMRRAERMRILSGESGKAAWENFQHDWPEITRLKVSSSLTERAASLAREFGLRGYAAMHLSTALTWQDALEEPVLLATFDRILWMAGKKAGIATWPETLVTE